MSVKPDGTGDIKRKALRLEKAVTENRKLRSKYPDDPRKFVESEVELEDAIAAIRDSAVDGRVKEWLRLGTLETLASLLGHENSDLSLAVLRCCVEMMNEAEDDEDEEEAEEASSASSSVVLVDQLWKIAWMDGMWDNLKRVEEEEREKDGWTVERTETSKASLEWIEAMIELEADGLVGDKIGNACDGAWVLWLAENVALSSPIRSSAAEVLAVITQQSPVCGQRLVAGNGVARLIEAVEGLGERSGEKDSAEVAFNVMDTLCCILMDRKGRTVFVALEGFRKLLEIARRTPTLRGAALKAMDFALSSQSPEEALGTHFIEAGGLGVLFAVMKKAKLQEDVEHCASLTMSLFQSLSRDGKWYVRLIGKLRDGNFEVVRLLAKVFGVYIAQSLVENDGEEGEDQRETDVDDEEQYLERLERGLSVAQLCAFSLAAFAEHSAQYSSVVSKCLESCGTSVRELARVLTEYGDHVGERGNGEGPEGKGVTSLRHRIIELSKSMGDAEDARPPL